MLCENLNLLFMKRMKKGILYFLLSTTIIVSACSAAADSEQEALAVLAPETEMKIVSSMIQDNEFVSENKLFISEYDEDECYDITPDFVAENSDFAIFKYIKSTESFIIYDDHVYSIGTCFGGYGITSVALADINMDHQYELYYTFSWGSGIHRSEIGYFDPVNKEITIFDESFYDSDMMLTVNESGDLCVNSAVLDFDTYVDFSIKAENLMGKIIFDRDEIVLNMF